MRIVFEESVCDFPECWEAAVEEIGWLFVCPSHEDWAHEIVEGREVFEQLEDED